MLHKHQILLLSLVLVLIPFALFLPVRSNWVIEVIDNDVWWNIHGGFSLALDLNGNPHVSYSQFPGPTIGFEPPSRLKYAKLTTLGWSIEIVDKGVGIYSSLAIDANNNPYISYNKIADYRKYNLMFAKWTGSEWAVQVVDNLSNIGESSLVLDVDGNPHVSYYDETNSALKYARWSDKGWSIEIADDAGDVGRYTSLALDANNNPHISYSDVVNYGVKYAKRAPLGWQIETVENIGDRISGKAFPIPSIAIDADGNPHISYQYPAWPVSALKYAKRTLSGWQMETVDNVDGALHSSIALDAESTPHIIYQSDAIDSVLKYARLTTSGWQIETVDGGACSNDSIAIGVKDTPSVVYQRSLRTLNYATRTALTPQEISPVLLWLTIGVLVTSGIVAFYFVKRK